MDRYGILLGKKPPDTSMKSVPADTEAHVIKKSAEELADDLKNALSNNGISITSFDYSINGATGDIIAYVTSGAFESKDDYERQTLILDAIKKELPKEESIHISGVLPFTPQEGDQLNK